MKRYLAIVIAVCLWVVVGLAINAQAACVSPDGRSFDLNGCTVSFARAPFGPGEFGLVTISCIMGNGATYDYACSADKCVIDISKDGRNVIYLMQVGDNMILMDYPALMGQ